MSNRSVKFAPALLAGVVAGASLATVTDLRAQVMQQQRKPPRQRPRPPRIVACPRRRARPPRAAIGTIASTASPNVNAGISGRRATRPTTSSHAPRRQLRRPASAAEEPAPPQQRTITRKSIADARAEWVSQQPRAEPNPPARVERTAAAAAPPPVVQNSPRAAMPNVLAPAPLSSMRWNDAPTTRSLATPTDLQVAAANPPASQPPQAEEVQQPAVDQIAPTAADAPPAKPTASLQKLLLVMAAALALAGLTVSAIVRIGRMRARRAMRRKRRAMWDTAKTKRRSPQPMFHDEDAGLRRTGGVYNPRVPQDRTRAPQERTRAPQERPRVPQERTRVPQERTTRVPQERPRPPQERRHVPQDRVPQDRVPHERERELQVTEMLARLARSAQT